MTQLEMIGAKVGIADLGQYGTKGAFPIDDDKIVTSTNMKASAYTIAAQPTAPCLLSVLATAVGTADTMGTLAVVGSCGGVAVTETITPVAGTTVYSTKEYDTITSITGAGWVIDAGNGNDTIKIGVADIVAGSGYYFTKLQIVTEAVVARQTNVSGFSVAELSDFTALPVGVYPVKCRQIALTSGTGILSLFKE